MIENHKLANDLEDATDEIIEGLARAKADLEERKASSLKIQYHALAESEQIDINNIVFDENDRVLLTNDTSRYEQNHYWNLAIQTSEKSGAKDGLYTKSTLTIEDEEFRKDLYKELENDNDLSSGNRLFFVT